MRGSALFVFLTSGVLCFCFLSCSKKEQVKQPPPLVQQAEFPPLEQNNIDSGTGAHLPLVKDTSFQESSSDSSSSGGEKIKIFPPVKGD